MASRYSKIQSSIWGSKKFNSVNVFAQKVYLYLLSCPHGNSAGFFRLNEKYAVADLDCTGQRYEDAREALQEAKLIEYEDEIIFIRQFLKFNAYANSNHAKGSLKEIQDIITDELYKMFYLDVQTFCEPYLSVFPEPKTVSKRYRNGIEPPRPIPKPITKTNTDTICAEQAPAPPVITLPLNDGSEYPVTQKLVDEMKPLYPAVDVMQQFRGMRAWLISNPTKRKTKTGIMRFINSWLSHEQDKGRASPPPKPKADDETIEQYANWGKQK